MDINFYATLRLITGQKTVNVDLPENSTVGEILAELFQRYPALHCELLTPDGCLRGHVHVFVNGRDVPHETELLDTRVSHTDKLDIFPAVGGG